MAREFVFFSGDYVAEGSYLDLENSVLPAAFLLDSNVLFGDGVFKVIRIGDGRPVTRRLLEGFPKSRG